MPYGGDGEAGANDLNLRISKMSIAKADGDFKVCVVGGTPCMAPCFPVKLGEGAKVGLGGDENTPHVVIPNPLSWMEGAFPF